MKTLIITDLARTETLDRATMTTVRGGHNEYYAPSFKMGDFTYAPTSDSSINAMQSLSQQQLCGIAGCGIRQRRLRQENFMAINFDNLRRHKRRRIRRRLDGVCRCVCGCWQCCCRALDRFDRARQRLLQHDQRGLQIRSAAGRRDRSRGQRGLEKQPGALERALDVTAGEIFVEIRLLREHLRNRLLQRRRQAVRRCGCAEIGK